MSIILNNERILLEIETEHGCIIRFIHKIFDINLIQEPRLSENFRVLVPLPQWRGHYIAGKEQTLTDYQTSDQTYCQLEWDSLRSSQGQFEIRVRQLIRLEGDDVTFRLEVENSSPYVVEEVFNIALGGLANFEERHDWRLHRADINGQGQEWSFYDIFPGSYLGPAHPVWVGTYPRNLSLPWLDLYNVRSRKGVYFGNHDQEARLSAAWMQLFPCTTYGKSNEGEVQHWPEFALTDDTPVGLTLAWNSFPFVASGEKWSGPPILFHFHSGIWWAGADYFRQWYNTHTTINKSGSWLVEEDAWQSTIISYPEGTIGFRFRDLTQIAQVAKQFGIRVLQIDGWDSGGIDRDYPNYTPDPRLGSWDELAQAIRECQDEGVSIILFSNLQSINIETNWYKSELHRYAVRDPFGNIRGGMGWEYNTTLGLLGQTIYRMIEANPSRPQFQQLILQQLQNIVQLGARATQLDKVRVMGEIDYSPDNPAPRDTALPGGVKETLKSFLGQAQQANSQFRLASELHWDKAVPFIDAAYARFFSPDHRPTFSHTFPEFRQTCCITGDWDFGLVNNCLRFGHIINVEARCLHGTVADIPALGQYIAEALRVRRELWELIWHSTVVEIEPTTIKIEGPAGLLCGLHQSWSGEQQTLVLNHFERTELQATISNSAGAQKVSVYRPFQPPQQISLPARLVVPTDQFVIVVFS